MGVYYVQWAFVGCELLIWLFGVCFVSLLWLDLILWRGLLVCCGLTCVARSLVWFAGECCLLFSAALIVINSVVLFNSLFK